MPKAIILVIIDMSLNGQSTITTLSIHNSITNHLAISNILKTGFLIDPVESSGTGTGSTAGSTGFLF